jgi:hypothetical protein
MPDNVMRDHRKLVIYDVNEAEPNRGAVFVMGIGIGEAYSNVTWEDRGFRVRGPAALEARAALRQALRSNGYSERDIPAPLREVASKRVQEESANFADLVGSALQVHNEVGFGAKKSSIARAMLYNLAQPGAVIIVPDQLWMSETWAGMLTGAAARGASVQIIAPALANAPIPDAPAMARAHDVLMHMLALRDSLTPAMAKRRRTAHRSFRGAGAADDADGRLRAYAHEPARYPWIRRVIPFDDKTLSVLGRVGLRLGHRRLGVALVVPLGVRRSNRTARRRSSLGVTPSRPCCVSPAGTSCSRTRCACSRGRPRASPTNWGTHTLPSTPRRHGVPTRRFVATTRAFRKRSGSA